MRGHYISRTWKAEPGLQAPPRYRRPCRYDAFIPRSLAKLPPLTPALSGEIDEAEEAIRNLNAVAEPGLQALARLLVRSDLFERDDPVEFFHPVVRTAIYDGLESLARSEGHRRAAEIIVAAGAAAARARVR